MFYLVYLFKVQPIGELKVLPFLSSYHYFVIPRWLWSRLRDLCLNLTWDRFLNPHPGPYHRLIFPPQRPDPSTSSSGSGCFWILQCIFVVSMHPLEKGILWKCNMWIVKQKSSCLREFIAVQPESVCGAFRHAVLISDHIWAKLKSTFICMWNLIFVWSSEEHAAGHFSNMQLPIHLGSVWWLPCTKQILHMRNILLFGQLTCRLVRIDHALMFE